MSHMMLTTFDQQHPLALLVTVIELCRNLRQSGYILQQVSLMTVSSTDDDEVSKRTVLIYRKTSIPINVTILC